MTSESTKNPVILVVDDDDQISTLVKSALEAENFSAVSAKDGEEALSLWKEHKPDLVILDIMLPKIDGIEVCRKIRSESDVPILMLTVKAEEFDKILGLSIGADDYLTKPFSTRELLARVKAVLRRSLPKTREEGPLFRCRDLEIDFDRYKVTLAGQEIKLTVNEYKILQALTSAPGRVFTRDKLIEKIYSNEEVSVVDRVIDVHIVNLRAKIEKDSSRPGYILTVRGMGYKFTEET